LREVDQQKEPGLAMDNSPVLKKETGGILFVLLCAWTFVLVGRPQDLFLPLAAVRPALLMALLIIPGFLFGRQVLDQQLKAANPQVKGYLALFLLMIVGIPFSIYPKNSLFSVLHYAQIVLFFFVLIQSAATRERIEKVLFVCCLGIGIYSVHGLLSWTADSNRFAFGEVYDPNDLAYLVVSFIMFNFYFLDGKRGLLARIICVGNIAAGILLLLWTGSRSGFVGLGVMMVLMIFSGSSLVKFHHKALMAVALAMAVFIVEGATLDRYRTITAVEEDYNMTDETGRVAIWKAGIRMLQANPLTGVGVKSFPEALRNDRVKRGLRVARWQSAHNSLVQIGAETGILGFFLFGLLSFRAFGIFGRVARHAVDESVRRLSRLARIGFAGHFTSAMFLSHAYSIHWAFYIALSVILGRLLLLEADKSALPEEETVGGLHEAAQN
jgi:O-antigen ligase